MLVVYRAPWRLAVYYAQSKDERILPLLQAQLRFFEKQDQISAGYKLDGTAMETYSNIAFQAPVWSLFKVTCGSCSEFIAGFRGRQQVYACCIAQYQLSAAPTKRVISGCIVLAQCDIWNCSATGVDVAPFAGTCKFALTAKATCDALMSQAC